MLMEEQGSLVPEIRTMLPFSKYRLLSQVLERMLVFVQMPEVSWDQTGGRLSRTKITRESEE